MPTILYEQGFRFSFYAADGHEPPHVHVAKGGAEAKWWLDPVAAFVIAAVAVREGIQTWRGEGCCAGPARCCD